MRRSATTLFRFFVIALAAVWIADANFFIPTARLDLGIGTAVLASCPPATMPAVERGGIDPNGPVIAGQCPEACPDWQVGTFLRWVQEPSNHDWIGVRCNNGTEQKIWSQPTAGSTASTCWNCVSGCGTNCPPGELCIPKAGSIGSDCRRYGCSDPRYTITEDKVDGVPVCRLAQPCDDDSDPVIDFTLSGPSSIRTGTTCSWSAENVTGGRSGVAKSYTWYVSNNPVGWSQWYTGGRPSGTLIGYSWRLRVNVTDGFQTVSKEILVRESSSAPPCFN